MIDITPILQGLLGLLATLITLRLIPWIKSKTTEQQQRVLMLIVEMLVRAAEQKFGEGRGAEKLEYVKEQLMERGYEVDEDMIQAAVLKILGLPATVVYQIDGDVLFMPDGGKEN